MPSSIAPRSGRSNTVAHQQAPLGAQAAFEVVVLGEREVHRDRLRAGADLERHVVVLQQQAELLEVVVARTGRAASAWSRRCRGRRRSRRTGASRRAPRCRCARARRGSRRARAAPTSSPATKRCSASRRWAMPAVVDGAHLGQGAARGRRSGWGRRRRVRSSWADCGGGSCRAEGGRDASLGRSAIGDEDSAASAAASRFVARYSRHAIDKLSHRFATSGVGA